MHTHMGYYIINITRVFVGVYLFYSIRESTAKSVWKNVLHFVIFTSVTILLSAQSSQINRRLTKYPEYRLSVVINRNRGNLT